MAKNHAPEGRVFNLTDWLAWFDRMSRSLFAMSGEEFEEAYRARRISGGSADDLGSVLPLIDRLREKAALAGSV